MAIRYAPAPTLKARRKPTSALPTQTPHLISSKPQPITRPGTSVKPPTPTAAATPMASIAAPSPIAINPVALPSATAGRIDARQQFGGTVADVNTQLRQLA